jgi:hypothetical protein
MFLMYISADIDMEKKIKASCEAGALFDNCYGRDFIMYGLPGITNRFILI